MKTTSWVIIEIETGRAIMETFNPKVAAAVRETKYRAIPILEYLTTLNRSIKKAAR